MSHLSFRRAASPLGAALLLFCCQLLAFPGRAQQPYGFEFATAIPVVEAGDTLRLAWAGGLNVAAFSKMDFDGDGTPDLLVWDAQVSRPLTFLARNGRWEHAPAYERAFPVISSFFVQLRDYDGDNRPDLWTVERQFVALYRNVPTTDGLGFAFQRVATRLRTEPAPQPQPLLDLAVAAYATLSIEDVDADGDPDVLTYDLGTAEISLHRNVAGAGATPVFQEVRDWGGVSRCSGCQSYAFQASGTMCRPGGPQHTTPAYTLLAPDLDGDGDRDLLTAKEYCRELDLLTNLGSAQQELFTTASLTSPLLSGSGHPALITHAPAAFYDDVTFDGQPDLLVVPWLVLPPTQYPDLYDTQRGVNLFARTGPGPQAFAFQRDDFLQSEMVDAGENAAPTLGDLDGDGDLDLLVGNLADYEPDPAGGLNAISYNARLRFYRNVGTPQQPVFRLDDADFGGFAAADKRAFGPVLTDLDGNGTPDLILRYANDQLGLNTRPLGYILNTAAPGQLASFPIANLRAFEFGIVVTSARDIPTFYDVDGDGDRDMLLGTQQQTGALQYLQNRGGSPDTAYVLTDPDFGRLPNGAAAWRGLSPVVVDVDGNGTPELLTADDTGELRVWPSLLASPLTTTASIGNLVRSDVTQVFGPARLGLRPVLTAGDLDADGFAEVLAGTPSGGLRLLRHQPTGIVNGLHEARAAGALDVFPNPATSQLTVRAADDQPLALELLDLLGRSVAATAAAVSQPTLSVAALPAGTYLLRATLANGSTLTRRVVVGNR